MLKKKKKTEKGLLLVANLKRKLGVILSPHLLPTPPFVNAPSWGEEGRQAFQVTLRPLSSLSHPAPRLSTRETFALPLLWELHYHLIPCSSLISDVSCDQLTKLGLSETLPAFLFS